MKSTKSLGRKHNENLKLSKLNTKNSSRNSTVKLNNYNEVLSPSVLFLHSLQVSLDSILLPLKFVTTKHVSHFTYTPFSKASITHSLDSVLLFNSHFNFSFLTFKDGGEGVNSYGEHTQG